jgi:superfamily II DNA or RNA helicase
VEVVLTVRSRIKMNFRLLKKSSPQTLKRIRAFFTYKNPTFIANENFGYSNHETQEFYKAWKKKGDNYYFGRGCLNRLQTILKDAGHSVLIRNRMHSLPPVDWNSKTILRAEQEGAVQAILKGESGLCKGDCSIGKTVILLEAMARSGQPAIISVWSDVHQKQWINEALNSKLTNLSPDQIGGVGGIFNSKKEYVKLFGDRKYNKRPLGILNVCMQQSLRNPEHYKFFQLECGFIGFDEVQYYGALTFDAMIHQFPALYRVGVTADERRKDKKQFLIYDSIGSVIHQVETPKKSSSRILAKINLVKSNYKDDEYAFDRDYTELLSRMACDLERNKLIILRAKKKLEQNKIVLILVERKEQALILQDMLVGYKGELLIGKQNNKRAIRESELDDGHKDLLLNYDADESFTRIKDLAYRKKLNYIIATKKGDVGLNSKTIEHLVIGNPTGGDINRFNQQKGRVERTYFGDEWLLKTFGEKERPTVDYIWDHRMPKFYPHRKNIIDTFGKTVRVIEDKKRKKYFKGE